MEHLPLHAELTLPAREPRELRAACDPSRPLAPAEQVALHEDLSAVQGGDRIGRIERRVREAWRRSYLRELVTGHAGCGKSTELLRLVTELRKPKQGKAFHAVYLDAYEYLNPHEVRLPQILVALLVALSEEPRWDLKKTRTGPVLWDRLRKIFRGLGRELGKDLADASGLPLLRALFRVDLKLARGFRKSSEDQLQELLTLTRDLITEVAAQLPPEVGDVVFIVDNLEKLPESETESGGSLHEILFCRELPLLDLPAHLVLTYPIALNYSAVGLRQLFANSRQTTIPMVGVRAKPAVVPDGSARGDDSDGIAALRRLLGRRVALDDVFADGDAVTEAARLSGGCVRDLLRIVGDLPSYGAQPYTRALVGEVAADLVNDYERLLQGKPYLGLLHEIARTGEFPAATTDEWKRQLLMNLIVLEYDTGTWYDVHPLVKATRAFRSAQAP